MWFCSHSLVWNHMMALYAWNLSIALALIFFLKCFTCFEAARKHWQYSCCILGRCMSWDWFLLFSFVYETIFTLMDFFNRNKLWDMLWSCFGITLCIRKGILVFAVLPSDSKVNKTKSKFQLWLIFSLCCRRTSNTTRGLKRNATTGAGFAATDEYSLCVLLYTFSWNVAKPIGGYITFSR